MSHPHHPHHPHEQEEALEQEAASQDQAGLGEAEGAGETPSPSRPQQAAGAASGAQAGGDLAAEVASLKDQLLRAMAESENTRRRMKKEIDDTQKYAVGNFAKEVLVVADNFQRALDAIPKDAIHDATMKNLVTGIEATERQLVSVLERFGIKKIEPMGHPFDPHFHRVMMEQDDASKPAGTVLAVLQHGYMIHDRLLREALVIVSKGGPVAHKVDTAV